MVISNHDNIFHQRYRHRAGCWSFNALSAGSNLIKIQGPYNLVTDYRDSANKHARLERGMGQID